MKGKLHALQKCMYIQWYSVFIIFAKVKISSNFDFIMAYLYYVLWIEIEMSCRGVSALKNDVMHSKWCDRNYLNFSCMFIC